MIKRSIVCLFWILLTCMSMWAQEGIYYTGDTKVNVDYHHGQLPPAMGVHNIQVMRASREQPETADGIGWTYNHAPMLAYWNDRFFLEYLNNPVGEHIAPGRSMLVTSPDGYEWSAPETVFPEYRIPDGTYKEGAEEVKAKNQMAVMHQRMGFYVPASGDKLLCLGYYGISLHEKDSPNDGKGIGRVVREIKQDGSFGPIYFIRYNARFNAKNTHFPFYKESKDRDFVAACDELLADPLMMQQWVEEADRDDPLIPQKKQYKALSFYHLDNGEVIGLWKHALTARSTDEGKTWSQPGRAPGFVNGNAKIWGQKTSDGKYATVYNPSEFRWPLAVSVSDDGLDYQNLLLVNGEITTMRYGGNYKSYGPQYVRGIQEGNGTPPDGDLWVSYSMNKEDIWVSRIEVPIRSEATAQVDDNFSGPDAEAAFSAWNIYSPVRASVRLEDRQGDQVLALHDGDAFDYATASRLFPASEHVSVEFEILPGQNDHGQLQVELQDRENAPALRLIWDEDGYLKYKDGYRVKNISTYKKNEWSTVRLEADVKNRFCSLFINGEQVRNFLFFNPVQSLQQLLFRTGETRRFPNADTPTDQDYDVDQAGKNVEEAVFFLKSLTTAPVQKSRAVLDIKDYKKYVDYFNRMEDENIVQAIPNDQSWDWMQENIPLFDCPQDNFREMYYYRWWSFRKHIKRTPVGNAITEFLVERSYADKFNLIACAIGHHTYESRWLLDNDYLKSNLHVWYRGLEGDPMGKLHKFSSWTADAVYKYYLQSLDTSFVVDLLPDLVSDYENWEVERQLPSGLFWQEDVKDGMEEQISGGRRVKNRRPTINSYMYANAKAISAMAGLARKPDLAETYDEKAMTIKALVQDSLWNEESGFFETIREKGGFAEVREAIGYIPWYFNLPDAGYDSAWAQVLDPEGFLAPFGLTTAEQRHPEFRSHGCCNCEWDGAVWPFSTSQVLTGMANLLNNYEQEVVDKADYFELLDTYVESQYYRGRPYIGEYLDETTGYWLKGDQERSRYYNHSTFNDLIITGLAGLRPRPDNTVEVNPMLPADQWDWFCLDRVPYHGVELTIIWDKTGQKYKRGAGLTILQDGQEIGHADELGPILCELQ
ncbi:MGH1-like glycoside hydrolase domain-containing protein [Flavilitoribacter nigricans]|uniref:Six-hairpin glycosidase n=1 Tax=Flavilitoribacter nigricans (strain ATCC 23147 / DSM 23189 / NBRC 102662 / NCIMB 1420 / SS-2) TaxID=1122177 RepID=A0A2D0N1V0_FLAN2|nr:exo-alpha-sialidase [Flavilitoribacter nigricans]PHN02437.1 six-hairpin glycosidase [Flavilitoribacter nigricans DSM 23189 = NBRC 102662]